MAGCLLAGLVKQDVYLVEKEPKYGSRAPEISSNCALLFQNAKSIATQLIDGLSHGVKVVKQIRCYQKRCKGAKWLDDGG